MTKIAILASYNGSGFDALYQACKNNILNIEIVLVISNNSDAKVFHKAKNYGIEYKTINNKLYNDVDKEIYDLLTNLKCEYIFLSGYMKKISPFLTNSFKIINSHPSLLPNYGGAGMYGRLVHEAVIKNKEKISGVTIHEVNENYDEGKIVLQNTLELASNETVETLENKIKDLEKTTIVEAFVNLLNPCK